ncbi:hypothetical protein [Roseibacillus persicicus]|nr:hypothetical protein [Roseibacillus persicicus]
MKEKTIDWIVEISMQGDAQRAIVVLGNSVVRKRGGVVLKRIVKKGDEV